MEGGSNFEIKGIKGKVSVFSKFMVDRKSGN